MDSNHLRVDLAFDKQSDYNFTLFVGNLPFTIKDEEMYKFFEKCGKISYVRVIRDPKTFYGKGIGYVSFCDKEAYSKALLLN
jgi:nucleolar protein 12